MIPGIYKITETTTGKFYIGSSIDPKKRWAGHRTALKRGQHHSKHLQRAWDKYGAASFRFEIIEPCPNYDDEALLAKEQEWLDTTQCYLGTIGFNISRTARAPHAGRRLSQAHREAIAAGNRGRAVSEDTKAKIAASLRGRSRPKEVTEKMRQSLLGRTLTTEHKAKISAGGRGRVVTPETRAKIAASHGTSPLVAAQRLKNSQNMLGNTLSLGCKRKHKRPLSVEHKQKISKALSGRVRSAAHCAKISAHRRGTQMSAEAKQKLSAARKGQPSNRRGIKMTEDQKQKISKSLLAYHQTDTK